MQSNNENLSFTNNDNAPLIRVEQRDGKPCVSARELYEFLGYNKAVWSRWYPQNIVENPYALENEDWVGFNIMLNGNESKDFALSINFAKKLAMMARTEKGEQARQYFIDCEKKLNALPPKPKLSYMQQPAEITREEWVVANHWLDDVQARVNKMEAVFWETVGKVETLSIVNNENRYDTVQDYFEAMGEAVTPAQLSYLIKLCKGISKSNGVMIGNYGHGVMSFSKQVLAIAYSNFVTTGGKVA